jgi:hypothetical protein
MSTKLDAKFSAMLEVRGTIAATTRSHRPYTLLSFRKDFAIEIV